MDFVELGSEYLVLVLELGEGIFQIDDDTTKVYECTQVLGLAHG